MADIDLKRTHGLGLEAARRAAERAAAHLREKFGLQGDWAARPIALHGREEAATARSFFKGRVLKGGDFKATVKANEGAAALVTALAADLNGIGFGPRLDRHDALGISRDLHRIVEVRQRHLTVEAREAAPKTHPCGSTACQHQRDEPQDDPAQPNKPSVGLFADGRLGGWRRLAG